MKHRYRNKRYRGPGDRGTVKPQGTEWNASNTILSYLSAYKAGEEWKPRVFWLHPTKGWRSQGDRP